jgi:hypothetical protein
MRADAQGYHILFLPNITFVPGRTFSKAKFSSLLATNLATKKNNNNSDIL